MTLAERRELGQKIAMGQWGDLYKSREPLPYLLGSDKRPDWISPEQERRFWSRVDEHENGCWLWIGYKDRRGYGFVVVGEGDRRRTWLVHRLAFVFRHGEDALPKRDLRMGGDALTLDHLCRNPSCVNPDHLQIVSVRENNLRADGFAGKNAQKTHCKRGHPLDDTNTYHHGPGKRSCRTCRRESNRKWAPKRKRKNASAPTA